MDVLDGLKSLNDDIAQIIVADPPYNIGKDFGITKDKIPFNEYLDWCDLWIKECIRILKPNGTFFIFGMSEILCYIFTRIDINKRWLVWHYTNKNSPNNKYWQRSHESIICCWKNDKIFNVDDIREDYTDNFLKMSGKNRTPTQGRFSKKEKITYYNVHPLGALPRDVIKIPTLAGGSGNSERWFLCRDCDIVCEPSKIKLHKNHNIIKHPTQKPISICDKLVLSAKQKDGIVLVPFAGIGSECVSAKKQGLDFISFELNEEYIKIANERLK
jgi:site-specific DNA-methyltransferase (adenine-specific)